MPIFKGAVAITSLLLGSTAIVGVYKGETAVYTQGGGAPPPPPAPSYNAESSLLPAQTIDNAAHRYWRIINWRNGASGQYAIGVAEIEMREAPAGADVTQSAFAIGSNEQAASGNLSFEAAFADDGAATFWQSAAGTPIGEWIGQDFGAGNLKNIVEITMRAHPQVHERTPRFFHVQYSDDGVTWTTKWTNYKVWTGLNEIDTFTCPAAPTNATAVRHWMIQVATHGNQSLSAGEIELRETIGGADQANGGTAYAMTVFSGGNAAANAFDNNVATIYGGAAGHPESEFIAYDFGVGVTKTIREIVWTARADCCADQNPKTARVYCSADGKTFVQAWGFQADVWIQGEQRRFASPYAAMPTSTRWRLRVPDTSVAGEYLGLTNMEMHETLGTREVPTTATASATLAGYPASNAADTTAGTFWTTGGNAAPGGGHWIEYEFAAAKTIHGLVLHVRPDGFREDPLEFFLEYWDGAAWIVFWQRHKIGAWGSNETRAFTRRGAEKHRAKWRLNITAKQNGGGWLTMREAELRVGGVDQTVPYGPAGALQWTANDPVWKLFDNNAGTIHQSGTSAVPHQITYDFLAAKLVNEIALTAHDNGGDMPTVFDVQWFNHATQLWVTEWTVNTPATWAGGEQRSFVKP